jgi:hypothetical protein
MPLQGEYEPSSAAWVRDQVDEYDREIPVFVLEPAS